MIGQDATKVIQLYNRMAGLTTRKRPRMAGFTAENGERAGRILRVVGERQVGPGPYLASCFAQHGWVSPPDFAHLTGPRYQRFFDDHRDEAYQWWRQMAREWQAAEPIKLSVGRELVKRRLLSTGGPTLCAAQRVFSGGYNQVSPICRACSGQEACRRG